MSRIWTTLCIICYNYVGFWAMVYYHRSRSNVTGRGKYMDTPKWNFNKRFSVIVRRVAYCKSRLGPDKVWYLKAFSSFVYLFLKLLNLHGTYCYMYRVHSPWKCPSYIHFFLDFFFTRVALIWYYWLCNSYWIIHEVDN